MNDVTWKRLGSMAISVAADVMDSTDPDDRTAAEVDLVALAKSLYADAIAGDRDARDLIFEAAPSWVSPEMEARWRADATGG